MQIQFHAQLKNVTAKTTASNDREYSIRLTTEDAEALKAGTLPTDELIVVTLSTV